MREPDFTAHKFYANENFPLPAVEHLRTLGYDVLTTKESGLSNRGIPDADVLNYAVTVQRAIVTFNRRDFVRLHVSSGGQHTGIIVCSEDSDYKALAGRIHVEVRNLPSLGQQLIRINKPASQ